MKRRIGVVTVARSDYGIYYPLLRAIQADAQCELCLFAGGAHLSSFYGNTAKEIECDGFPITARVEMLLAGDSPQSVAASLGIGVINFANAYTAVKPDILVLLGDRFEMLAAAVAAVPLRIPLAHIHGGELTQGAIDDAIRHAITKLSHLHFAAAPAYARRIRQMGEESERVIVSGAPIVDSILAEPLLSKAELETALGVSTEDALLITYHPVTLQPERTAEGIAMLLDALAAFADRPLIFTYPNADANNAVIVERLRSFTLCRPNARLFVNLGRKKYLSLQRYAAAMVGNSSSGIIEAASFRLPVVNIGDRQMGRLRTPNIIDVPEEREVISQAVQRALSPEFRASIARMESPYGNGDASQKILHTLKSVALDQRLLTKKFRDCAC
jgi:UDP-N-acetylglucosamine 2-epimerase (non-hydrolysing)/GDP/UDP-N,N'-diacetylbacillosamine 2-epimerase (hydrolysing)